VALLVLCVSCGGRSAIELVEVGDAGSGRARTDGGNATTSPEGAADALDQADAGSEAATACTNRCTEWASACPSGAIVTCTIGRDGCFEWGLPHPCGPGDSCVEGGVDSPGAPRIG
jgi:hypothetical protein